MSTADLPVAKGGSEATRISVDGQGYLWTGMLVWGHRPFGSDPISWTCERCGALTVDVPRHNDYHAATDQVLRRALRRLGLPEEEV